MSETWIRFNSGLLYICLTARSFSILRFFFYRLFFTDHSPHQSNCYFRSHVKIYPIKEVTGTSQIKRRRRLLSKSLLCILGGPQVTQTPILTGMGFLCEEKRKRLRSSALIFHRAPALIALYLCR